MDNKTNGHTLVELIISMGIFTVIIGSLFSMILSQNNLFGTANVRLEVSNKARKVMINMVKELRMSKMDLVDIYDKPFKAGGALEHINGRSISFQVPVDWDDDKDFFDEFGIIEWGADGQLDWSLEYYYDSKNSQVIRSVKDGSGNEIYSNIIATEISAFNIQGFHYNPLNGTYESLPGNYTRDIVEITVTAQKSTLCGKPLAVPIAVTLRNKIFWRN